jgi:hypothetical protein
MDQYAFDEFSMAHFAFGILSFQTGVSFVSLAILYTIFKVIGNISIGKYVIDSYLTPVLGYKLYSESFKNIVADLSMCFLGWFAGFLLLKKEYNKITSVLLGVILFFWLTPFINGHIFLTLIGMGVVGSLFRSVWYAIIGVLLGYGVHNYVIARA